MISAVMDFRNIFTGRIVKTHRNQWQSGFLQMPLSSIGDTRKMLKIHRCFILPTNHGGIVALHPFIPHRTCVYFRPKNGVAKRYRPINRYTEISPVPGKFYQYVGGLKNYPIPKHN